MTSAYEGYILCRWMEGLKPWKWASLEAGKGRMGLVPGASRRSQRCQHRDSSLVRFVLGFLPPEL